MKCQYFIYEEILNFYIHGQKYDPCIRETISFMHSPITSNHSPVQDKFGLAYPEVKLRKSQYREVPHFYCS